MVRKHTGWGKEKRPFTKEEYKKSEVKENYELSYSKYLKERKYMLEQKRKKAKAKARKAKSRSPFSFRWGF